MYRVAWYSRRTDGPESSSHSNAYPFFQCAKHEIGNTFRNLKKLMLLLQLMWTPSKWPSCVDWMAYRWHKHAVYKLWQSDWFRPRLLPSSIPNPSSSILCVRILCLINNMLDGIVLTFNGCRRFEKWAKYEIYFEELVKRARVTILLALSGARWRNLITSNHDPTSVARCRQSSEWHFTYAICMVVHMNGENIISPWEPYVCDCAVVGLLLIHTASYGAMRCLCVYDTLIPIRPKFIICNWCARKLWADAYAEKDMVDWCCSVFSPAIFYSIFFLFFFRIANALEVLWSGPLLVAVFSGAAIWCVGGACVHRSCTSPVLTGIFVLKATGYSSCVCVCLCMCIVHAAGLQ